MTDLKTRTAETALRANPGDYDARQIWMTQVERETGALPTEDVAPWIAVRGKLAPARGVGVTLGYGSDQYPFTVVEVSKTGSVIKIRADHHRVISGSFMTGDAKTLITSDHEASTRTAKRSRALKICAHCGTKNRSKAEKCTGGVYRCRKVTEEQGPSWVPAYVLEGETGHRARPISIGRRAYYQDPSF